MEGNQPWLMAVMLGAGVAIGGVLFVLRIRKRGGSFADGLIPFLLGAIMAAIGGKLMYLLHNLGMDFRSWTWEQLLSWKWEEISFVGCCIGFSLGVWLGAKARQRNQGETSDASEQGKAHRLTPGETLDVFALSGCVMICLARIGEYGIDTIGRGTYIEGGLLAVFPFSVKDSWGDACLAVFMMEAITAAAVGVWLYISERRSGEARGAFRRGTVALCGAQLFWDMMLVNWIPCVISFIHFEQVLCAVIAMWIIIAQCVRKKKVWPAIVAGACLVLNGVMQFVQDKPYLFDWLIPAGTEVGTVATICFAISAIGIIIVGVR